LEDLKVKRSERFTSLALTLAAAATVMVVSTGCVGPTPKEDRVDFVEYELPGFPFPSEFVLESAHKYQPSRLKAYFKPTWIAKYRGSGVPADHVPFFLREMQLRGWELKQIVETEGKKKLEFINGDEGTTIELSRMFDDSSLYGSSSCFMRVEVRTLGLESFSIEENHALAEDRAKKAESVYGSVDHKFGIDTSELGHSDSDGHDHADDDAGAHLDGADAAGTRAIRTSGSTTEVGLSDGSFVESNTPVETQGSRE